MKVLDLSAWQENVDWQGLVDEGIEGVILKIGERNHMDDMFVDHVNKAVEYGLKYGVYYYAHASSYDEAVDEADIVGGWIEEYLRGETPELGIWYDAEDKSMLSGDVTACCLAFMNRLTDYGHQYNGIYSGWNWLSEEGAHHINMDDLPDYVPYWVAQYNRRNDLLIERPDKNIRIWQYTDHYSDRFPYDGNIYYDE